MGNSVWRCAVAGAAMILAVTSSDAANVGVPMAKAPEYGIVGWGGWIFNPSVSLGAVYDDNIYRSETNRIHSWGTEVIPSFTGELNEGIYRTSVYGTVDARMYSENNSGADTVYAKAGIKHVYEAQRDLVFRFSGDFLRQADPFNAGVVGPNGTPIVSNNNVNNFNGDASVKRTSTAYSSSCTRPSINPTTTNTLQRARDGTIYTSTGRLGFWITPYLSSYVEGSGDWRRYAAGGVFEFEWISGCGRACHAAGRPVPG